ncbi:MAG: hypothetical protein NUV75_00640 [Gallionella sp.]|nr:hypothetical protein [Gallionella sp.]
MRQEYRRGTRTVVYSIVALASIGYIGWIIWLGDNLTNRHIAYGLLAIVGVGSFGYIAENVTQRISFKVGPKGLNAEIGDAVEEVAEAAADKADEIKGGG